MTTCRDVLESPCVAVLPGHSRKRHHHRAQCGGQHGESGGGPDQTLRRIGPALGDQARDEALLNDSDPQAGDHRADRHTPDHVGEHAEFVGAEQSGGDRVTGEPGKGDDSTGGEAEQSVMGETPCHRRHSPSPPHARGRPSRRSPTAGRHRHQTRRSRANDSHGRLGSRTNQPIRRGLPTSSIRLQGRCRVNPTRPGPARAARPASAPAGRPASSTPARARGACRSVRGHHPHHRQNAQCDQVRDDRGGYGDQE